MSETTSISIDVVSDVVCPWCYVGQKRMDKAVAAAGDVDIHINWRPFQLDATIPTEGKSRHDYLIAKFKDENRIREMHERLEAVGTDEGIAFDFDAIKIAPNTLNAHRVIRWAGAMGEDVQNRLVRRLFQLNFEQGANLGDPAVLIEAAREAGMDTATVEALLPTDADVETVQNEIATASRMGVTGVPCFLIEGKYAVMGAQEAETIADAIRQIAAAKARGELENAE